MRTAACAAIWLAERLALAADADAPEPEPGCAMPSWSWDRFDDDVEGRVGSKWPCAWDECFLWWPWPWPLVRGDNDVSEEADLAVVVVGVVVVGGVAVGTDDAGVVEGT